MGPSVQFWRKYNVTTKITTHFQLFEAEDKHNRKIFSETQEKKNFKNFLFLVTKLNKVASYIMNMEVSITSLRYCYWGNFKLTGIEIEVMS